MGTGVIKTFTGVKQCARIGYGNKPCLKPYLEILSEEHKDEFTEPNIITITVQGEDGKPQSISFQDNNNPEIYKILKELENKFKEIETK